MVGKSDVKTMKSAAKKRLKRSGASSSWVKSLESVSFRFSDLPSPSGDANAYAGLRPHIANEDPNQALGGQS